MIEIMELIEQATRDWNKVSIWGKIAVVIFVLFMLALIPFVILAIAIIIKYAYFIVIGLFKLLWYLVTL